MIYEIETRMGMLVIKSSEKEKAIQKAIDIQKGSCLDDPLATVVAVEKDDYQYDPKGMVISAY